MKRIAYTFLLLLFLARCSQSNQKRESSSSTTKTFAHTKPGSSYGDTLTISQNCAIFYHPDSVQKEKIKAVTDPNVFESSIHEFLYQQRNAHIFLKKYWPHLKIFEVNKYRYLMFLKEDQAINIIDLNQLGDSYGMIVFDPAKSPRQLDMMNIETEVPVYFKSKK